MLRIIRKFLHDRTCPPNEDSIEFLYRLLAALVLAVRFILILDGNLGATCRYSFTISLFFSSTLSPVGDDPPLFCGTLTASGSKQRRFQKARTIGTVSSFAMRKDRRSRRGAQRIAIFFPRKREKTIKMPVDTTSSGAIKIFFLSYRDAFLFFLADSFSSS